ncbi:MAG: acetate--CoA ligase family protein [Syntrophobacterales bacterium]|jgi:acetyltransferase|nr:acetate--CoA ligase family protein [Syntrophobacterales bacterium]
MQKFFYPRSVAVVGVSEAPTNLAQGIVANLLHFKYQGKIFLVGRRPGTTYGLPIFPGLSDLPEKVDLVTILAPAKVVPALVRECGELGISRVVVESAGFSELSEAGSDLEEEVQAALRQYGIRLVGPNGLGLVNLEIGLALPFAQMAPDLRKGRISIIAQSGGVATHMLAWMNKEGLGLNKFLSLGNKLNVGENEALEYLLEDPGTEAIYVYLEGLQDGRGLLAAAAQATKPVYLHLANVGPETAAIAHSHTASLTTDERVLEAACRQSRITRVKTQSEFLNAARLVGQPAVKGNRLVVFSRSGGEAVVAAYACRQWGFTLPPLSDRLAQIIRERSRAGVINPTNPIDLGDVFDFTLYTDIMAAVCRDPEVDAVLFNYGPLADFEREAGREMARRMLELGREAQKPVAVTLLCTLEEEDYLRDTLGVPPFYFPEDAVQALALSRDQAARAEILAPAEPPPLPETAAISGLLANSGSGDFLALSQALSVTAALGLPAPPWEAVTTAANAAAAATCLGFPVVLKLSASSLVHKTEAGAVILNLEDAAAVEEAFARLATVAQKYLPAGEPWQVVVMSQVAGGREVLLGARRDDSFGPVVAFGAGGVDTEILDDVSLRVAPLNPAQARELVAETRIGRILAGTRGQPAADLDSLNRALAALSQLMMQFPAIQEVDLNPVRLFPGQPGLVALDARIRVGV